MQNPQSRKRKQIKTGHKTGFYYLPRLLKVLAARRFALCEERGFNNTFDAVCAIPLEVRIAFLAIHSSFI